MPATRGRTGGQRRRRRGGESREGKARHALGHSVRGRSNITGVHRLTRIGARDRGRENIAAQSRARGAVGEEEPSVGADRRKWITLKRSESAVGLRHRWRYAD